jgi:hypothetical protein
MMDGSKNIGGSVPSYRANSPLGSDSTRRGRRKIVAIIIIVIVLLALGFFVWWFCVANKTTKETMSSKETIEIPLGALKDGDVTLLGTGNLTMAGELKLEDGFVISPSSQPSSATPGQIYFDGTKIRYFNGSKFVSFATSDTIEELKETLDETNTSLETLQEQVASQSAGGVQSSGIDFTPGDGLALDGGVLSNTGVTSLQGMTGAINLTASNGIAINGTTISNTGIKSITAGTNISVVDDGNGNITISSAGGGGGTVSSPGGTAGRISKFTGVQEIADSIMTESGTTISVGGDLAVANDLSVTGDLTLTNALTVGNGGTGTTSLANNGVVIGQGANALTAVTAAGPGLCFVSTAGAPTFSACPNGGVTSLNGAIGDLTIANSSTAGSIITLDDASTSQKGIAQFDSDNFTAAGGVVDTIQDINTGATPTFAGINTNAITPSGALTVGATGQSFTLQGSSASSITATNGANTTTVNFTAPTGNRTITMPDESGTVCVQNSANCGFALADNAFLQGGNSFGATAVLGTQDTNSLEIITNNTTRLTIDPNGAVSNQGSLRNAGHLAVGANSGVSNDTLISLDETFTSGTVTGVNGIIRLNPGATDSNYHTGMKYQLQTASGNIQNFTGGFRGVTAFVEHNGTGTMNEAWGGEFRVDNSSTGTINSAVGLRVQPNNNSGGGTIVDNYGLFIDSQTAGTNSNYALYTNSGTVRFGGVIQAQTLGAADTNTHLCRNSANQIATCNDAGASFVQGGNSFSATAVLGTNDANSLQIETNGSTQATIAVGGATTFQNSADSTGAFRVLNAASVPQFQVDTANSRVYIGNLTADGTGALLVLDTKNTAGDPTGVNGGMYYNSNANKFRCYEANVWTDCISGRQQQVTFTSSGTFTKASYPGMKGVRVQVQGGGGGGIGADTTGAGQQSAGAGGGGGAYAESFLTPDQLAASETVTVGAGGAGTSCSSSEGGVGGTSSFGSLVSASGGFGGFLCMFAGSTPSLSRSVGGEGRGTATGQIIIPGTDGGNAMRIDGTTTAALTGGYGGNSQGGKGGPATSSNGWSKSSGDGFGGGGSGAYNTPNQAAEDGAAGGPGVVVVIVFF